MQESELSYQAFFENLPAMVHSAENGVFRAVSNVWLEKTGYTRDEVVGKSIFLFAPADFHPLIHKLVEDIKLVGYYNAARYDLIRKDGTLLPLRASSVSVKNPVTGTKNSLTILADISPETKLLSEVQKQQAALISAARMASLGEMASGIAHEINNPLTIIHGKASQIRRYLQKASLDLPPVEEMLDAIEKTSMRIAAITRSLRAFAREGSEIRPTWVPLASVVDETLLLCQSLFKNNQIELRLGKIPPDLKIECRPADMSQAILNLLKNAFEAVSKSASEKRVIDSDHGPWISVDFDESFGRARLLIRNNGGLIPEEIRDRIMHPFFTTKVVGSGTGLGLSVAKGLIESQDGRLYLDETAQETTFVVEFAPARITR